MRLRVLLTVCCLLLSGVGADAQRPGRPQPIGVSQEESRRDELGQFLIKFAQALRQNKTGDNNAAIGTLNELIETLKRVELKRGDPHLAKLPSRRTDDDVYPLLYASTECGGKFHRMLIDALTLRGTVYGELKKYDLAVADISKALRLCPAFPHGHIAMADVLNRSGKYKEARDEADKAIAMNKDLAPAYKQRSIANSKLGKIDEAKEDTSKVVEITRLLSREIDQSRKNYYGAINDGIMLKDAKPESMRIASTLIKHQPRNLSAIIEYANSLFFVPNLPKLIDTATVVMILDPKNPRGPQLRSGAYMRLSMVDEALRDSELTLKLQPNNIVAMANRATALRELGMADEALAAYTAAIKARPDSASLYNNRSALYVDIDEPELAMKDAKKAISIHPEVAYPYANLGYAQCRLKKYKEARESLEAAIKLSRKFTNAPFVAAFSHYYLGVALENLGEKDEARKHFDQSMITQSDLPKLLEAQAVNFAATGFIQAAKHGEKNPDSIKLAQRLKFPKLEEVIKVYDRMIQFAPKNSGAYLNRALCLFAVGKTKDAARDYEKVDEMSNRVNPYLGALRYLCYERLHDNSAAQAVLKEERKKNKNPDEQSMDYLRGTISEKEFLAPSKSKYNLTKAHMILGLHLNNIGKTSAAKKHFEWIMYKGDRVIEEAIVSIAELKRMAK